MTQYSEEYEDSLQMDVLGDIAGGMPWLMLIAKPVDGGQIDLEMRVSHLLNDSELIRGLLSKTLAALPPASKGADDDFEDEVYD